MEWPVTVAAFKSYFDRGQFSFGNTAPQIRDKDIEQAFGEAMPLFNENIYPDDNTKALAYLYLAAHFVASDADAAETGGMASAGVQTSRSADGVSESLQIPDWIIGDPMFSQLCTTYFGRKYVLIASQYVVGVVSVVGGATLP
jgi:hypothetical protein